MTDFTPQSTNRLPGDTSPDTYRVLFRGSFYVNSTDYALTGSWYSYTETIDLGQYNFAVMPMIEFYAVDQISPDGEVYKCPSAVVTSAGALTKNFAAYLTVGVKSSNQSTKVNFVFGGLSNTPFGVFYQVMSLPAGGSLFPALVI